jgi:hypothetical protein
MVPFINWRWKVIEPRADKIYPPIQRSVNKWIIIILLVGFTICIVVGLGFFNLSSIYAPVLPSYSNLFNVLGILAIYVGVMQLFILVIAHVGRFSHSS